jgi:pimeloyl-ACP methyl ester carboxylesterase
MLSRFAGHYILHDRGTPDDSDKLAEIMSKKLGTDYYFFKRPQPPYEFNEDVDVELAYRWVKTYFLPDTLINSVILGIGIGGLLAAKLQEDFPARNLSVIAVNAPTAEGSISLEESPEGRVALYSSLYSPLASHCDWSNYATQAYDAVWLSHGIKNTKYALAYLLSAYMRQEDISTEYASVSNLTPAVAKAAGV